MNRVTTRSGRGHLLREAEKEFAGLKNELINSEVADLAINMHGLLSTVSAKYSSDAIIDIIPNITLILNKYDAALKVNSDLKQSIIEMAKENTLLINHLESEKNKRRQVFEDSLHCEEQTEEEIKYLKSQITNLKQGMNKLRQELVDKTEIINVLSNECNTDNYSTPKNTFKPRSVPTTPPFPTVNKFSILSQDPSPSSIGEPIQVQALVHACSTPVLPSNKCSVPPVTQRTTVTRRKIVVLADSQGKELGPHLKNLETDFQIFVHSSPGAKLKHVIRNGLRFVEDLTDQDFVIVLAGSNDLGKNEPAQLTITQGLKLLSSIKKSVNVLVNSVPYRHDDPSLNNNIFFTNHLMHRMISKYNGPLNMFYGDVNNILNRSHFTKHGLHYSRNGKAVLGKTFTQFIRHQIEQQYLKEESPSLEEKCHQTVCTRQPQKTVDTSSIEPFPDSQPLSTSDDPLPSSVWLPLSQTSHLDSLASANSENFPPVLNSNSHKNTHSFGPLEEYHFLQPPVSLIPSSPMENSPFSHCRTTDGFRQTQTTLDDTTASEPWGGACFYEAQNSQSHFLDLQSWPNLVR